VRILHIPIDLGGHPSGLARAQQALGHEAIVGNLAWSPFGFRGDRDHGLPYGHPLRLPRREAGRIALLAKSILWADVIHAHFGQTLTSLRAFPMPTDGRHGPIERAIVRLAGVLWLRDIQLWRRLGKTVAMTFYGDDLRPVACAEQRNPWTHLAIPEIGGRLAARDAMKARLSARLASEGVKIFAVNPDLMEALPTQASFLPYCHLDVSSVSFDPSARDGPVRFVHMPSNRLVKGSEHFIAAVKQLQAEGLACSLTLVEAQDHAAALAALGAHDVLLDQLHVGWYGAVAVEAMASGLPVVAHIVERDRAHLPATMSRELPVIAADPSTIVDVLRSIVRMPAGERGALAAAGRGFVERWHDPAEVAAQVLARYEAVD